MVKTSANNVSESKKKIANGNKRGSFVTIHLNNILKIFSKRYQIFLLKAIIVVFAFVASILIVEIVLRIIEDQKFGLDDCVSLDEDFHHVMIPDTFCRFKTSEWDVNYEINTLGLRDSIDEGAKGRILVLGDSYVQGHGVSKENTFVEILEEKLNEDFGKFEVINAGVFGYSPLVEYLYLKKEGLKFEPELVILALSLTDFGEDRQRFMELGKSYPELSDNQLKDKIKDTDIKFAFEKINPTSQSTHKNKFFEEYSFRVKSWLRKNFRIYGRAVDFFKIKNQHIQQDAIFQGDINKDIVALIRGEKISDEDWEKLWELPMLNLELIKHLLDVQGIDFVVVGIPEAVQVSDWEWPNREALGLEKHFEDSRGPFQEELESRLNRLGIDFINLLPDFKKSHIFPLYFTEDGHFRESGHELAASVIYNALKEKYLYLF